MSQHLNSVSLLQTYPFTCCLAMLGLRRSNHAFPLPAGSCPVLPVGDTTGRLEHWGWKRFFCLPVSPLQHSFTEWQHILSSGFLSNPRASLIKDILLWILNHSSVGSVLMSSWGSVIPKQCPLSAMRSESWSPWGFFSSKILIFNNSKLLSQSLGLASASLQLLLHDTPVFLFPFQFYNTWLTITDIKYSMLHKLLTSTSWIDSELKNIGLDHCTG